MNIHTARSHHNQLRHGTTLSALILVGVVVVSCGSGVTSPSQTTEATVLVVGAVTSAPTTIGVAVTTSRPEVGNGTPASPTLDTTAVDDALIPVRNGARIDPGHRYTTGKLIGEAVDLSFLAPAGGAFAAVGDGYLGIAADANGRQVLVQAAEMDLTTVLINPSQDLDALIGPDDATPAPADVLGWFASRPGVTAGVVENTQLGGLAARKMAYSVGTFEGQTPCTAQDDRLCLAALYNPVGAALYYSVGDSGTMYELVVEGRHLLVDVADRGEAAPLAASIKFTPRRPANVPADAQRLPLAGPLTQGSTYFWTGSSLGTYMMTAGSGLEVRTNWRWGRSPPLEIDASGAPCMSISDGSTSLWFGTADSPTATLQAMPDDLLATLTTLDILTEITPPVAGNLDGHATMTMDLTARVGVVDLLGGSLSARAAIDTRLQLVSDATGRPPDVAMVDAGSQCDSTFSSLGLLAAGSS